MVKLRIQQIFPLEEANAFLPAFIEKFNIRFAVTPKDSHNPHRRVLLGDNLHRVFTITEESALSKNLIFQNRNTLYQVEAGRQIYTIRQAKIVIYEDQNGGIKALSICWGRA